MWLIDLDKNTFEAYKGFNTTPLEDDARFKYLEAPLVEAYEKAKEEGKEKDYSPQEAFVKGLIRSLVI